MGSPEHLADLWEGRNLFRAMLPERESDRAGWGQITGTLMWRQLSPVAVPLLICDALRCLL